VWYPDSIAFTNLFSHKQTTYHFKHNEMDLILGLNKDGNGSDSNGGGKSTLAEAINLAITGEVYRKVSKTEFIRRGQKECIVIFTLHHSVTQEIFRIERQFFNNSKSNVVRLFEQPKFGELEKELTKMTNSNEANKYIFTKLGISKEDFLNYYVIGQGNPNSFFALNDAGQKAVIARFSNYDRIDSVLNQLKIDVDKLNENLEEQKTGLFAVQSIIEHLNAEISEQKTQFEQIKKEKLQEKSIEIDDLKQEILNAEEKINNQVQKEIKSKAELKTLELKVKNVDKLKAKLSEIKQLQEVKRQELKEIEATITDLNKQSGKALECPKCKTVFIPDSDLNPAEVAEMLKEVEAMKTIAIKQENEIYISINDIREQINQQSEIASQVRIKNNEIKSFIDIKNNYQNQLENKNKRLKNLLADFQTIKSSKPNNSILTFKSKLELQKQSEKSFENQIKLIEEQIQEKQFFQYHFGKSGLKTYLANKSIKAIQDVTNYYLEKLGTNYQVQLSGYKVLKSGEVRDQITTKVIADGIEETLFNAYSGGEKERIDACGSVAINFMINNSAETGGLNLIVFDERSWLDSTGQRELVNTLSKIQMTCILVLHHVDNLPYKNKTYIEKRNKISSIIDYKEPVIDVDKLLKLKN